MAPGTRRAHDEAMSEAPTTIGRIALGLAASIAAGYGSLILAFVGMVETTGCLIECAAPNPAIGVPALVGAVVVAASGVAGLAWGFGARHIGRFFGWSLAAASAFVAGVALIG